MSISCVSMKFKIEKIGFLPRKSIRTIEPKITANESLSFHTHFTQNCNLLEFHLFTKKLYVRNASREIDEFEFNLRFWFHEFPLLTSGNRYSGEKTRYALVRYKAINPQRQLRPKSLKPCVFKWVSSTLARPVRI